MSGTSKSLRAGWEGSGIWNLSSVPVAHPKNSWPPIALENGRRMVRGSSHVKARGSSIDHWISQKRDWLKTDKFRSARCGPTVLWCSVHLRVSRQGCNRSHNSEPLLLIASKRPSWEDIQHRMRPAYRSWRSSLGPCSVPMWWQAACCMKSEDPKGPSK